MRIGRLVRERKVFPCYFGSALKLKGVEELLAGFQRYGMAKGERKTEKTVLLEQKYLRYPETVRATA